MSLEMADTRMSEAAPVPDVEDTSPQSSFQLRTTSIRNSTAFKTKSADVFGSLESIERGYNSAVSGRGLGTDGEGGDCKEVDEEEGRLDGCIKRGCIFRKPSAAASSGATADRYRRGSGYVSDSDRHRGPEGTETGLSSALSSESRKRINSAPSQTNHGDSTRTDRAGFRKPTNPLRSRDTRWGEGSGRSRYRGRDRSASSAAARGRMHQRTADHVLNPQKYTKYSLEETSMCGNAANRSIALGFLSELRKRNAKEHEDQTSGESCPKGQVIFKKPVPSTAIEEGTLHPPAKKLAYGTVYKMPEYEVGNAPSARFRKPKMACPATASEREDGKPVFALDHLQNEQGIGSREDATESDQSEKSNTAGNGEADQSDQGGTVQTKGIGFMNRKGKRRQIRQREEEET